MMEATNGLAAGVSPLIINVAQLKAAWNTLSEQSLNESDHSTVVGDNGDNFSDNDESLFQVDREDAHEMVVASRLCTTSQNTAERRPLNFDGEIDKTTVEGRMRWLEKRAHTSQLRSCATFRELLHIDERSLGLPHCDNLSRMPPKTKPSKGQSQKSCQRNPPEQSHNTSLETSTRRTSLRSQKSAEPAAETPSSGSEMTEKDRDAVTETAPVPSRAPLLLTLSVTPLTNRQMGRAQWFEVVSNEPLTTLRDSFCCNMESFFRYLKAKNYDLNIPQEAPSLSPSSLSTTEPNNDIPPSFFYIEGTFYSDTRGGMDDTKTILDWINAKPERKESFKCINMKPMEGSTFEDLNIILDKPYSFMHIHGNCEHLVTFHRIRLANPYDQLPSEPWQLPFTSGLREFGYGRRRIKKCRLCPSPRAQWLVHGNTILPEHPCPLCHTCLIAFHYTPSTPPNSRRKAPHKNDGQFMLSPAFSGKGIRLFPYFYD